MLEVTNAEVTRTEHARAGKYLTLTLGETEYGVGILSVREIISMIKIIEVPRTPEIVLGVMNLRGKIIPVVDLRRAFGMESVEEDDDTRIIVVEIADLDIGIVVDGVKEVIDLSEDSIDDAPSFFSEVDTAFVLGIGKQGGRVSILLDIDKVLGSEDVSVLRSLKASDASDARAEN